MKKFSFIALLSAALCLTLFQVFLPVPSLASEITRGTATGQATAKGYDHPDQFLATRPAFIAPNMEPVVQHAGQDKQAAQKLAALEKRFGKKPNILIFLMDDVAWLDMGFNGGGAAMGNATPIMDGLAQAGLILTSAYSAPSCTPTRATIHTGQNPLHHGILRPAAFGEAFGLDTKVTLPTLLGKLGYVTQGVGKWHIGENPACQPHNVGYDDYWGFLGVSDMYTEWRDTYFCPEIALSPSRFGMMYKLPFQRNEVHCVKGQKECQPLGEINLTTIKNLDQNWADYSEAFIRKMAKSDRPWFLYHATRGCHFDNYPNDKYMGRSRARTVYSDCVVEQDDILARLVKALEETGQLENTMIVVTSDNGPECELPPHGRTPFRGCKGSSWEGGVRVPTFVFWKGMITPRRSEGLFDLADLYNTALAIAGKGGAEVGKLVPKDYYIDGIDQLSFIVGDQGQSNRRSRIYTLNQYFSAVRIDEFKMHIAVELEKAVFPSGSQGGFSGAIIPNLGGLTMTNLYTNPQEDVNQGLRHLTAFQLIGFEAARYKKVLQKFPPKRQAGF